MKKKNSKIIVCPCCGAEYLPGEIYLPDYFVGQPTNIEKTYSEGKIMYYNGKDMDLEEHFTCDRCNTRFKVKAKVSFETEEENYNINNLYKTSLKKQNLFLKEE